MSNIFWTNVGEIKALLLIIALVLGYPLKIWSSEGPPAITLSELRRSDIIGMTGKPLGKLIDIEAVVIDGDKLDDLGVRGRFLLRITKIDGKEPEEIVVMKFVLSPNCRDKIATHTSGISEDALGDREKIWKDEEIEASRKTFVGQNIKLCVIENAYIQGLKQSEAHPSYTNGVWQNGMYDISTYLLIMQQLH